MLDFINWWSFDDEARNVFVDEDEDEVDEDDDEDKSFAEPGLYIHLIIINNQNYWFARIR
jgi:hypothetical protein